MLDYDGTLAPFTTVRDRAFPYPGVQALLQEIIDRERTRVVIVSGRDAQDTARLLNLDPTPEIWGLHGLQQRRPDGTTRTRALDQPTLDALAKAAEWVSYQNLRTAAEFKAGSIAVHWRGLDQTRTEEVRGRVLLGWHQIAEETGLKLLEFDGGIEICSRQADKGHPVRVLLAQSPGAPAAYLGDDATDERAFLALQGHGLTVLVRREWRETNAQMWLKPPEELLTFLTHWLRASNHPDPTDDLSARAAVNS